LGGSRDDRAPGRKREESRTGGVCVDRWWVLGGDRGSWLGLRLSSASWVIGKAPASAQQLGMSLGCSVMGERAASVLCGLCRQLKNLIQTCRPALCLCCSASSSHPTRSCCPPTVRLTPHHHPLHTDLHSLASSSVSDPASSFASCCFLPAPARYRKALDARVLRIVTPAPLCTPNSNYSARTLPTGRLPLHFLSHELWFSQTTAQTCFFPPREAAIEVDLQSQKLERALSCLVSL
jgi:hypothetical protein